MSAKAADNTPAKLDKSERDETNSIDFDMKLFADSQPTDTPANGAKSEESDTDLDITTDPFGREFNELGPVAPPKAADGKLPDVLTDPFAPEFTNLPKPGEVNKPEEKGTKSGEKNDPFDPFGEWTVPGDLFPTTPEQKPTKPGDTTTPQDAEPKPDTPAKPDGTVKPDEPVKPDAPVKPGDQPAQPGDAPKQPNPVFNENNVGEAIKLAQSKNQPIYVFSTPNGQLDQAQQDAMKANAADAVFVNVNFAHADQMMRAGLETTNYWQLANLCGAGGDVNNLYQKPGFMGRFNASDFNANDPKNSLKAAATGDLKTVFAGQVKPPAPQPDAPVQPDAPKVGPDAPKPDGPKPDGEKPESPKPDAPKDNPDAPKDNSEKQPEKEPVKLDKLKFDSYSLAEAIQTAKDNNLPLIVYKGADFCGNCPRVSSTIDSFANELKNKPTTDAVIVKLNYEATRDNIQRNDPALFNMINQIMPINNSRFPEVAVYNPNDMSKPLRQDASGRSLNGYGGDINHLRNLVAAGRDNLGTTNRSTPGSDSQQDRSAPKETRGAESTLPPGVMSETDVQAAQQAAKAKNVPMLSYLESGKGSNENLAKAMQYLSENGLASAVKINRQTADGMLQRGLETSKFYALKNAMLRTPDVAQDGSSHLSAFAPGNFGQPKGCTEAAKSPEEIVSFLKKSGVDLSKGNSEAAVRALLEGKPVPAPESAVPKPDATPVEPEQKKPEAKPELPPQPESRRPEQAPPPQVVPPQTEVKPETQVQPEVTPENFKPEETVQPEAKPEEKPEAKPELGVKPEAPTQPRQINPEPMVLPTPPEATKPEVKPEVKPAFNFEPTLPKASDILPAKAEKEAEKQTKFKVKDAEEALKVIEDAKASGKDLVVHSPTVICTDDQCIMTKLPDAVSTEFSNDAVFLELPRGGVTTVPEGAQYDALREINDRHKVSSDDHKTQIDLHVYSLNKEKAYQLSDQSELSKQIETAIKRKAQLPHLP